MSARTLFGDQGDEEVDAGLVYDPPNKSGFKYVRLVASDGGRYRLHQRPWQARVPVGPHSGSPRQNLGLFPNPREAWRAAVRFATRGELPPGVLPTYVRQNPDGSFSARAVRAGQVVEAGPVATAQEAGRLIQERLAGLPPRPRRPGGRRRGRPRVEQVGGLFG